MYANAQSHVHVGEGYRGTVKSLKWKLVFTNTWYSASCSSSLCLKPCHASSALGSPRRTSMPMTLLSLNCLRNVSGGFWLGKKQWRRRTESKSRKDEDHDLWYRPWPPAEFRWVSIGRLSHWSGQQQHLLQWMQALGSSSGWSTWQRTLFTDVHGARELPASWTADHWGKSKSAWQAGGCSFLLLPRRHALSSQWLWTFNHNMCENRLEANLKCLQRNDGVMIRQICNIKPQDHHQIQCAAWHWGSGSHSEEEKAPLVWTCEMLQWCSQDCLWHTDWWK